MLSDNFMWFPQASGSQISGETTDQYFAGKGASELNSFTFNIASEETTEAKTAGKSAGKAKFGLFTVEKKVDTASVPLYKACCQATIFPSIMVAVRKAGGDHLLFMQYVFRYNQVTSVAWSGANGTERPGETIIFSFKAMGVQYISQTARGGQGQFIQQWSWNAVNQGVPGLIIPGIEGPPDFLPGIPG
jgi:type VI protein secretion system component Hcp